MPAVQYAMMLLFTELLQVSTEQAHQNRVQQVQSLDSFASDCISQSVISK